MKRKLFKLIVFTVLLITVAISCNKDIRVSRVLLTPTPLLLCVDVSATLTAIVLPPDATNQKVSWTSSNTNALMH